MVPNEPNVGSNFHKPSGPKLSTLGPFGPKILVKNARPDLGPFGPKMAYQGLNKYTCWKEVEMRVFGPSWDLSGPVFGPIWAQDLGKPK